MSGEGPIGAVNSPRFVVTSVVQVELFLLTVVLFPMPDVLPHLGFIQTDRAHTVVCRPNIEPLGIPAPFHELPMDSTADFPFNRPIVYTTLCHSLILNLAGSEENLPSALASGAQERQSLFGSHRHSRWLTGV